MDFLKLVQKKEHKTDNKIIAATVVLVVFIMSTIVFWPAKPKHHLLTYLPEDVSFYLHFTNKNDFLGFIFAKDIAQEKMDELESILGSNFLNLQEVLWFQIDNDSANDNYLLEFSRLPKSYLLTLENQNLGFEVYSPDKNILLINKGKKITHLESKAETNIYFDKGVSVYWQKNKAPEFLQDLASTLEPAFAGDDVLLNWQSLNNDRNRFSLLENKSSDIKDIKGFLMPKEFDMVFGFNSVLSDDLADNISEGILKSFFDSLPYYNLDSRAIKDRLLTDAMLWQKDDTWILASHRPWQDSILDFIDNFNLKEVPRVLSDGTAYIELVASEEQNTTQQQLNGQKILQIDNLFIWDIGDKHYLSNKKESIEELSSRNQYLSNILGDCLGDIDAKIGDIVYFDTKDIADGQIKDYLLANNISSLNMLSYATGTISGLNICF